MKRNKIKRFAIITLAGLIILGGLIYLFRTRIVLHFIPKVEQIGHIQIKIKNDTLNIGSNLRVINKSILRIHIDSIRYKVALHEKTYLQSKKFIGIVLGRYGEDTIDFSLNIPYKRILKDLSVARAKLDSTTYSIEVSLIYSTIFGKIEIPINKSAKFKIPQPPEIRILDVKYKKVHNKYIIAEAKIKITNYSTLCLSIKELHYAMNILRQGNLKGMHKTPININPQGNVIVSLPIEINMQNIGKTIFDLIIDKDNYYYTLTLNAILDVENPIKESYHIGMSKSGMMELKI